MYSFSREVWGSLPTLYNMLSLLIVFWGHSLYPHLALCFFCPSQTTMHADH